jgi:hypothetical protein
MIIDYAPGVALTETLEVPSPKAEQEEQEEKKICFQALYI